MSTRLRQGGAVINRAKTVSSTFNGRQFSFTLKKLLGDV